MESDRLAGLCQSHVLSGYLRGTAALQGSDAMQLEGRATVVDAKVVAAKFHDDAFRSNSYYAPWHNEP